MFTLTHTHEVQPHVLEEKTHTDRPAGGFISGTAPAHTESIPQKPKRRMAQSQNASSCCQAALHHCHAVMHLASAGSPATRRGETREPEVRKEGGNENRPESLKSS